MIFSENRLSFYRRKWNVDGPASSRPFFDARGPTDEATIEGRKRLSSILFA